MSEENKQILNTAYKIIIANLSYGDINANMWYELYEIRDGNKQVLLEHLKAINSITGKAIKLLGDVEDDSTK